MSHLHVPDGILPGWVLAAGYVAAALLLAVAAWRVRRADWGRLAPRLAAMSALMLLAMSVPLGVLPYHLNLTILAGILLGPAPSVLAVACVGLFLALVGHGGITVLGLNTVLLAGEAALGWVLFGVGRRFLAPAVAAALATAVTLVVAAAAAVAMLVVSLGGSDFIPGRFVPLTLPLLAIGTVVESAVVAAVVGLLARVRPDLVAGGAGGEEAGGKGAGGRADA